MFGKQLKMTAMTYLHIQSLSPLYEAVQISGVFPDSKFFPDCTPKSDPTDILLDYAKAKGQPGFDLKAFVETHFELPETPDANYQSADKPIQEHLENLWTVLLRKPDAQESRGKSPNSTLILLPNPYVVPGGRFREVYYWDSYFTMLGLQVSGRVDIIESMVDNFAQLIDTFGHVPNGNRTYYLSRSQPPFFALMASLLAEIKGEEVLLKYLPSLKKEHEFWERGRGSLPSKTSARVVLLPDFGTLNRYWDDDPRPRPEAYIEDIHTAQQSARPAEETYRELRAAAESGWDFSSRWLADEQNLASIRSTDFLPVDLNCLLYFLEKTLVRAYRLVSDAEGADIFNDRSGWRRVEILKYCWDTDRGFFFDFDHTKKQCAEPYTLAAVFPLFFQIANQEQAASVAKILEEKFLRPGGLVTTLSNSGQQWDAPNGWAPLQWIAYRGLANYGHTELAEKIRQRWLETCEKTYAATGKMMEKYDVENPDAPGGGGEYPNQDGFGWTNGVYLKMKSVKDLATF